MDFKQRYADFFETIHPDYFNEDRFVPAVGPERSDFMLVGEAPGANEVEESEPFVGQAGNELDKVLEKMGMDRSELYITNLVKIRPPDNRDPKKDEIEAWKPLLEKEIENVDPDVIVPLGNFASKEILNTKKGITSIHGRIFSREGRKIMPCFHPAAVLYDRTKEEELEKDLRKAFGKENTGQKRLDDL